MVAYLLTGSVGLLSDAIESLVNMVGAVMALSMLTVAARPADDDHAFGHGKAEYFSSGVEGALILVAAVSIAVASVKRLLSPRPVEQVGIGLAVSIVGKSVLGLMDTALPPEEMMPARGMLNRHVEAGVQFHALRTRQSGARRFMSFHVLVPGGWTVQRGHALLEEIERGIRDTVPNVTLLTHLVSLDDQASWDDVALDRPPEST